MSVSSWSMASYHSTSVMLCVRSEGGFHVESFPLFPRGVLPPLFLFPLGAERPIRTQSAVRDAERNEGDGQNARGNKKPKIQGLIWIEGCDETSDDGGRDGKRAELAGHR